MSFKKLNGVRIWLRTPVVPAARINFRMPTTNGDDDANTDVNGNANTTTDDDVNTTPKNYKL
jgi:hypothetical protein